MKREWIKKENELLEEIENTKLSEDEIALWYLGQSGFLIKQKNTKVLIDPVLTDLKDENGISRRYYEPPFSPEKLKADIIFSTHDHRDHLNKDTILGLVKANLEITIVIPAGIKQSLLNEGIDEKNLLLVNEEVEESLKNLKIQAFATCHPVIQKDENNQDLNLSYLLNLDGFQLLHLGDTYLCEELVDDLSKIKELDLLMAPINGQDYFRTARNCIGNLSGYEAAMAAKLSNARTTIPCHYDMIKGNTCSPFSFIEAMEKEYPKGCIELPRLGQRLIFKKERKSKN